MTDEKVITTEQDIPAETLENVSNNKGEEYLWLTQTVN